MIRLFGKDFGFLLCRVGTDNLLKFTPLIHTDRFLTMFQATMMQVTISSSRLPQYRERLIVGTMLSVSGFDVSRCAQSFRLTESSLLIRFNEDTTFEEITDHVSPLPEEAFRFRNQSEMIGLAKTNTQFPGTLLPVDTYLLYCWTSVCKEYGLFIFVRKWYISHTLCGRHRWNTWCENRLKTYSHWVIDVSYTYWKHGLQILLCL